MKKIPTWWQKVEEERAKGAEFQINLCREYESGKLTLQQLAEKARAEADRQNAEYPQYKDRWKNWVPIIITRRIGGKGGTYFEAGDYTLGIQEMAETFDDDANSLGKKLHWTAYSFRIRCNVMIARVEKCSYVKELK